MAQVLFEVKNVISMILFGVMMLGVLAFILIGQARKRHPLVITAQCIALVIAVFAVVIMPVENIFYTAPTIEDAMVLHGSGDHEILELHETHDLAIVLEKDDEGENWWVFFPKTESGRYLQSFPFASDIGMKHNDENGLLICWFTYSGTETCYIEIERFGGSGQPLDPVLLTDSRGNTFGTQGFELSPLAGDVSDGVRYTLLIDDYTEDYAVIYDGEIYKIG